MRDTRDALISMYQDKVEEQRRELEDLKIILDFERRPQISCEDWLYEEIERQQRIIEDQRVTIEGQKKSLREVLLNRLEGK